MATKTLNNPFSGYGVIVCGERFVGRQDAINTIRQRVLGQEFSNLSITGLPKIGKSSLVYHSLYHNRAELVKDKTIVVYYQIGSTRSSFEFFKKLLFKTDEQFEEFFEEDERYQNYISPLLEKARMLTDIEDLTDYVEKYYKKLRRWGYKIIVILDEFDKAQDIFELADFQELREISYEPENKICLVTCSRKTLDDIEQKVGSLSHFARIFTDCPLRMFDSSEITEYWERVKESYPVDDEYKKSINYMAGGYPWLMDVVNDYFYMHSSEQVSSDDKYNGVKLALMLGLDEMVSTLQKEDLLNAAIQLVIGPYYNVTKVQEHRLLQYGFIKSVPIYEKNRLFGGNQVGPAFGNEAYVCFSEFCTLDLYRRYYADIPYFSTWGIIENKLRGLVKTYLSEKYSSNWESEMLDYLVSNPPYRGFDTNKWETNVQRLKRNMKDMVSTFPAMKGNHIVDFTLTSQIFDIFIKWDWSWFGSIFKGDKLTWHGKFDHLSKVRNPVMHNNPGDIKADIDLAKQYCTEIESAISTWRKLKDQTSSS